MKGMTTSVVERTRLYRYTGGTAQYTNAFLPILYAFAPSCIIMHYVSFRDCNGLSDNSGAIQYRIRVRSDGLLRLHLAAAFDITRTNYVFQLFLPLLSQKETDGAAVMINDQMGWPQPRNCLASWLPDWTSQESLLYRPLLTRLGYNVHARVTKNNTNSR